MFDELSCTSPTRPAPASPYGVPFMTDVVQVAPGVFFAAEVLSRHADIELQLALRNDEAKTRAQQQKSGAASRPVRASHTQEPAEQMTLL